MSRRHTLESFKKYIGLPYQDYDCFELVKFFYARELNIVIESEEYLSSKFMLLDEALSNKEKFAKFAEEQKSNFQRVDAPQYGDILLFKSWGIPAHVGIYINSSHFLHTQKRTDACMERFSNWENRFLGYYRYDKTKT